MSKKQINHNSIEWGNIELPGLSDEELFSKDWEKSGRTLEYYSDPKNRKKRAEIAKKVRESEEWKSAHKAGVSTVEYKELRSQQNKDRWEDLEWRKWYLLQLNSDEVKEKMKSSAKAREADPKFKIKKAKALAPTYKDETRNKKISEKRKKFFEENPEERVKLSLRAKENAAKRSDKEKKAIHKKRVENGWLEKCKEAGKKRMKPIMTPAGRFESKKDAVLHYGFDPAMIDYWRKKKPEEWYYIEE